MKKEIRYFLTAILFYTRIPCPKWVDHSEEYLRGSSRYFPLVGVLVGALSAFIFWLLHYILPNSLSISLSMVFSILLTGALHEDGMADMCDGFGGGWTKEKILTIMKDSRIGTFGAIGLIAVLGLKFISLNSISTSQIPLVLIAGNSISRFFAISFLYTQSYAREEGDSKIRPMAHTLSFQDLIFTGFFGLAPLIFFMDYHILWILPILIMVRYYLAYMFKKWIGGYTGDCLGAVQQITEVLFYLGFIGLIRFH